MLEKSKTLNGLKKFYNPSNERKKNFFGFVNKGWTIINFSTIYCLLPFHMKLSYGGYLYISIKPSWLFYVKFS